MLTLFSRKLKNLIGVQGQSQRTLEEGKKRGRERRMEAREER